MAEIRRMALANYGKSVFDKNDAASRVTPHAWSVQDPTIRDVESSCCPCCGQRLPRPRRTATKAAAARRRATGLHAFREDEIVHLEQFGQELRRVREGLGMTRPALAHASGVSVSLLGDLENAGRRPRQETLDKICLALQPAPPTLSRHGHVLRIPGDRAMRAEYEADPHGFTAETYNRLQALLGPALAPSAAETRRRLGRPTRNALEAVTDEA